MNNKSKNIILILLSTIFIATTAQSYEKSPEEIQNELPKLLGSSNEGTEFFMTFHPCWESSDYENTCKIYIASSIATDVKVSIPGKNVKIERVTIPNGVIEISLDPKDAQCYRKIDAEAPQPQQVYPGYGIIVESEDPIICYGVVRYKFTAEGYLAIPSSALGKNYIVSSYNDPSADDGNQYLTSYTSIVGAFQKTKVKIKLGGRFINYTPGPQSLKTGDTATKVLNRGDVWVIGVMGDYNDLTGTVISADKPVSVISGNFCAYVPIQTAACDYLIEQDLPMESWGNKYHVCPIFERKKASIIRVFASLPNTYIYRDDNEWSMVKSVGGYEGSGFIERRAVQEGEELRPVIISAKNRIAVTQYNTGSGDDGKSSDPFQMSLVPVDHYQNSYFWCTPSIADGASFKRNYINLCYKTTEDGFIPNNILFGKSINGVISWTRLNQITSQSGIEFIDQTITDYRPYKSLTLALDESYGVYAIKANDPIIIYSYGYDNFDSYGYPVSACYNDLTKPDIWAPTAEYSINCQGKVEGNAADQPIDNDTLRSNLASMNFITNESSNFTRLSYDKAKFCPGNSSTANWNLQVINPENNAKAVIRFVDRAGNDTTISIEYISTKLSMSNKIEDWGSKAYDDPIETKELTLINESSKAVAIDSIFLASSRKNSNLDYNGFKLDSTLYKEFGGVLPGHKLNPGEQLKLKVSFDSKSLEKEIANGQIQFSDSVVVTADKSEGNSVSCYRKAIALLKAAIPKVNVDEQNSITGISEISPNPVKEQEVEIDYFTETDGSVVITIYNSTGAEIQKVTNGYQSAGRHLYKTSLDGMSQGSYTIEFKAGDFIQHKSFIKVK